MLSKLRLFKRFVGNKVVNLLVANFFLGIFWFVVELCFLFIIQGFLFSIGFLNISNTNLPAWYPTSLSSSLLIMICYGLVRTVINGLRNMIPVLVAQVFASEQRRKIIHFSFFESHNRPISEILSAFGDLTTRSGLFIQHSSNLLGSGAAVVLLVGLSLKLALYEALISYFLLIMIMLPFRKLNRRIGFFGEKLVADWDHVNKVLLEGLRNIFLLRVYRLLDSEYARGNRAVKSYETQFSRYISVATLVSGFPLFAGMLVVASVTFISKKYIHTEPELFVAFLYIFLRAATNASLLSQAVSDVIFYKNSFTSLYKISAFSNHEYGPSFDEPTKNEGRSPVGISLRSVDFSYLKDVVVLKNISLEVKPGDFLLIKGPSGAGKSTIIKLIMGMISPARGDILVGDQVPTSFMKDRSSQVGYVGPEPYLIPGTVRENLLYGLGKIPDEQVIWRALEDVGIDKEVKNFINGLNEYLNEETQLSTGQKQRVALARAMLRDPKLLILDEATANIDKSTETLILQYLKKLKGQVTVVAISHRNSFDELADKTVELNVT